MIQTQNLTTSDFINVTKGSGVNTFAGGPENATIANPPQAVATVAGSPQAVAATPAKIANSSSNEKEKNKDVKKPIKGSRRTFIKLKKSPKTAKAAVRTFKKSKQHSGVLRRSKLY